MHVFILTQNERRFHFATNQRGRTTHISLLFFRGFQSRAERIGEVSPCKHGKHGECPMRRGLAILSVAQKSPPQQQKQAHPCRAKITQKDAPRPLSVTLCMNLRHLKGKTYPYTIWGLRTRFWAENMELIFFLPVNLY